MVFWSCSWCSGWSLIQEPWTPALVSAMQKYRALWWCVTGASYLIWWIKEGFPEGVIFHLKCKNLRGFSQAIEHSMKKESHVWHPKAYPNPTHPESFRLICKFSWSVSYLWSPCWRTTYSSELNSLIPHHFPKLLVTVHLMMVLPFMFYLLTWVISRQNHASKVLQSLWASSS